jgi:hypothetical protein
MKATIPQDPGLTSSATTHASSVTSSANHKHWIGLQCLDGTRLLELIDLPGSTEEKMNALHHWRDSKIGPYHRFWQYVLCKRYYIDIGCLQVTAAFFRFNVRSSRLTDRDTANPGKRIPVSRNKIRGAGPERSPHQRFSTP